MTRYDQLAAEAITLSHDIISTRFFSRSAHAPGGRIALDASSHRHFLPVSCFDLEATGRMAACVTVDAPDTVIHHLEGHCPFRSYQEHNE